jgi:hypothetical protein
MTKELHDSLKTGELNTFIILYALRDYAQKFKVANKQTPIFVQQLESLIEKYDNKCTSILMKKNLISGEVNATD